MTTISIRVTPNAKKPEVKRTGENTYAAKVDAHPEKGAANARLVELLSEHFDVPKSSVRIIAGHKSRNKTIEIYR